MNGTWAQLNAFPIAQTSLEKVHSEDSIETVWVTRLAWIILNSYREKKEEKSFLNQLHGTKVLLQVALLGFENFSEQRLKSTDT